MSEDPQVTDENKNATEPVSENEEKNLQSAEAGVESNSEVETTSEGDVAESADDSEVIETQEVVAPTAKAAIPGADLEVDIVQEGEDPFGEEKSASEPEPAGFVSEYFEETTIVDGGEKSSPAANEKPEAEGEQEERPKALIDLSAGARYIATGKRKTAVARVILKPGNGSITVNNSPVEEYFPRQALRKILIQPLEVIGHADKLDVIVRLHGSGISSQAGALRHGIAKALLEADPNVRGELKKRGFLTRDARVKERRKAGLKKARKRPQFSKR